MPQSSDGRQRHRTRDERGIYRQLNGDYTVCFIAAGKPCFRAVGADLYEARAARAWLIGAGRRGEAPVSPQRRFGTVRPPDPRDARRDP
jgi:hypothetical protein